MLLNSLRHFAEVFKISRRAKTTLLERTEFLANTDKPFAKEANSFSAASMTPASVSMSAVIF